MGATTFGTVGRGKTAKEAFGSAVGNAQYEHGQAGYTGTIAEKTEFTMIEVPQEFIDERTKEDPRRTKDSILRQYAHMMIDMEDDRVADKWGPAGCIKLEGDRWFFFGWANE